MKMNNLGFGAQFYKWNGGQTVVLENEKDVKQLEKFVKTGDAGFEVTNAENQTGSGPKEKEQIAANILKSFNNGALVDINMEPVNDQRDKIEKLPANDFLLSYFMKVIQKPIQGKNEAEKEKRILLAANRIRRNTHREALLYLDQKGNLFDGTEGEKHEVYPETKRVQFSNDLGLVSIHNHPLNDTFSYNDLKVPLLFGNSETIVVTPNGNLFRLKLPKMEFKQRKELTILIRSSNIEEVKTELLKKILKDPTLKKEFLESQKKLKMLEGDAKLNTFALLTVLKNLKKEHNVDLEFTIEKLPDNIDDPTAKEFKTEILYELD